jgi:hypothetical protein
VTERGEQRGSRRGGRDGVGEDTGGGGDSVQRSDHWKCDSGPQWRRERSQTLEAS